MKTLILALTIAGFGAFAQGPQIEPGPVVTLGDEANDSTSVMLLAKAKDLNEFRRTGNTVTEVTRQNTKPGMTVWKFTRKQCATFGIMGGRCLGAGVLTVNIQHTQKGSGVETTVTSSYVGLRSGPPR